MRGGAVYVRKVETMRSATIMRKLLGRQDGVATQRVALRGQMANDAGGYAWMIDDQARFDRFLLLGSDADTYYTYYTHSLTLTGNNVDTVRCVIAADGPRAVVRIAEVSRAGRAR